jgi:hypothetical protein
MDAFKSAEDAERFIVATVYNHFRTTGDWPRAREFDLDHDEKLDPFGGLEFLCRQMGSDRISSGSTGSEHDRLQLHVRALAHLPEAADDVRKFLAATRLAARRFRAARGAETQLTVNDIKTELDIGEKEAKRAFELIRTENAVSAGGGGEFIVLGRFASKLRDVKTLEDYFEQVRLEEERRRAVAELGMPLAKRVSTHRTKAIRRLFLSHAATDATLAHYLADTLRQSTPELKVFVASKAGDIPTGADWLDTIETELRQADAYLLLLTPVSVERFWLWYESGAAWMAGRPIIPVTAAGLEKSRVPYPLGARQALALDVPADVVVLASDLGTTISEPERFCEVVADISKALPRADRSSYIGVEVGEQFFAWAGPLDGLTKWAPVVEPPGVIAVLKAAGATPSYAATRDEWQSRAKGLLPVYETDRKTWRREILLPNYGDQHLLVKPPKAES